MKFGFTKSVLLMAVFFSAFGLIKSGSYDSVAITHIFAPVFVLLIVLVPIFIIADLLRWKAYLRQARSLKALRIFQSKR